MMHEIPKHFLPLRNYRKIEAHYQEAVELELMEKQIKIAEIEHPETIIDGGCFDENN